MAGGDFTNFVSQALSAGGWEPKAGFYRNTTAWWYRQNGALPDTWAWAWSGSQNFWHFNNNTGRATRVASYKDMLAGDVLQIDYSGDGTVDHSAIVVEKTSSNMYLAQHTIDDARRSYLSMRAKYPNARWHKWHYVYGS